MSAFSRAAALVNKVVVPVLGLPVVGPMLGRGIVVISYTGRRSGARFELPVGYRRQGDTMLIQIAMPDRKTWWRNFTGDGGPIEVHLPDGSRTGHAVSRRDDTGAVTVAVDLEPDQARA